MKFSVVITIDKSDVHAKGRGQRSKVKVTEVKTNFVLIRAFPDCNFSLNSHMATKWGKKLAVTKKWCPIVFQGHLSNFKVKQDEKSPILTQIGHFRTVTPVWFHRWLWNDTQSLKWHGRGILLFVKADLSNCKVTRDKKIADFDLNWAFPDWNYSLNWPMAMKCYKMLEVA